MADLASKDEQLARRLAALEEAENEADLHDESLAIELAEREREVARLKKVFYKTFPFSSLRTLTSLRLL